MMALENKEILRLLSLAGVGPKYKTPEIKLSDYPTAEEVFNDIKGNVVTPLTGILVIGDKYDAPETMHMITRFMAYPLRRTAYICPAFVFYDFLRGNENPRLMTDDDERGILNSKHLVVTDIVRDNSKDHVYGSDMRQAVEDFIMGARYRDNKIVHLHASVPVSEWNCFSQRFRSFVVDNYKAYAIAK